jgi:antitoxin YefM
MDAMTYTTVRANLASAMDRVCDDHEALIITRNGEQSVVMLSLEDYKSLEETAYLLRTPANAKRLLAAAAQLNAGKGIERKLGVCPSNGWRIATRRVFSSGHGGKTQRRPAASMDCGQ